MKTENRKSQTVFRASDSAAKSNANYAFQWDLIHVHLRNNNTVVHSIYLATVRLIYLSPPICVMSKMENSKIRKFNSRNVIVKNEKMKTCDEENAIENSKLEIRATADGRQTTTTNKVVNVGNAARNRPHNTGRPDCGHDDDDDDDDDHDDDDDDDDEDDDDYDDNDDDDDDDDNYDDYDDDHDDYDEDEDDYDDYDEDHDDDDHDDDDHDDDDHNDDNSSKRHCRLPFVAFTIIADVDTNDINHSAINMSDTEIAHERIPGGVALHLRPPTL